MAGMDKESSRSLGMNKEWTRSPPGMVGECKVLVIPMNIHHNSCSTTDLGHRFLSTKDSSKVWQIRRKLK
jgi:hypothetical protein